LKPEDKLKKETKQLWLLAGGNGAGKSTFYRTQLAPRGLPFVNADNIAKQVFPDAPEVHSYQAALMAERLRNELLQAGRSFCYETVFSHPSKIDFVGKAKALGYEIIIVFVHLSNPELNKARILQRIEEGGHSVPEDKVVIRIPRTMQNIKTALKLADKAYLLDNSSYAKPFQVVAQIKEGKAQQAMEGLPDWALFLLDLARAE
jgi:predicted ABC-type ATPase